MSASYMKINPNKLKIALVNQNMSVHELSRKSGVSTQTLYRVFNKKRATLRVLSKIIKGLNIGVEELI